VSLGGLYTGPDDAFWMRRAIAVGSQGGKAVRPNPRVGCLLVREGVEIAAGFHAKVGTAHAEKVALALAGPAARGSTAYVTLEPCKHTGRTGPCTQALIDAGVARVVVGALDPFEPAGGGVIVLREAGIEVVTDVETRAARHLAETFLANVEHKRAFVQLKLAMTLDGRTAAQDGSSRWITGTEARHVVHQLRAEADAVLIGSGTVLADDPRLDLRDLPGHPQPPLRVVFDRRLRTPSTAQVCDTARQPTLIVTTPAQLETPAAQALRARGVELLAVMEPFASEALRALLDRGVCHVLCEGGATLAGELLQRGLVDRLDVFVAGKLLGAGRPLLGDLGVRGIAEARELDLDDVQRVGPDLWVTARPRPPARKSA
jgi:diaminohydroxyphosphoribosylaminopyrimidine deaminase/5-amino-6-(5-phosphoribosylamino)uracil reductase